ncbi:hypothetical protein LHJ74_19220 [Streptomyces sp. N2-109]|uniref:Flp pilus-assembly TadG-like N-terminal domain-containing protein n=1 Tax=Streptomyces gossypii TaxID=2883101 RepID=A0ABT2JVZ2_9ACTN|nr:hypothetical protein [Streptomyces gossypii]MCT2592006.1 hypothetical protein [Streptomyces gossypii]
MAGLLFLAFAFFAVAQAATVRNGGQSAADAAALAAARDDRDEFFDGLKEALGDEDSWQDWLDLTAPLTGDGCGAASDFAGKNDSDVLECGAVVRESSPGYTVRIETRFDTGRSIIPGAEGRHAQATATAVVEPRCDFDADADAGEIELDCDGDKIEIDPESDEIDLEPADLFSVVLVD